MTKRNKLRPVAAFDLDGTLVREHLLAMLTKECIERQIFPLIVKDEYEEIRGKHLERNVAFEKYDEDLIKLFVERIKGRLRKDVQRAAKHVFERHRNRLYVFTRTLLNELKPSHQMITITGAMDELVSHLSPYWGFEHFYASLLEVDELGRYTGFDKSMPVYDKGSALNQHLALGTCTLRGSVAIGDTKSDAKMLALVDHPIAFNPNDALSTMAEERGWPAVVERKDCIYVFSAGDSKRFRSDNALEAVRHVLRLPKQVRPTDAT